ncbi:MAG: C69 family dipeptidase, partial [Anaerolineae bacterium]|nr:C69 family dipeptidase [Anaerolineae bacterium]
RHEAGAQVKCTYIEIPQVEETYEVLLSRPFWMWGCEMGVNECGVAIGNEAVFTKEPYGKQPGLIGMDFIRLALERADTARRALDVIVDLLGTWGQSGNCSLHHKLYYHNSFIIADPGEAWVLETVAKFWAAERVRDVPQHLQRSDHRQRVGPGLRGAGGARRREGLVQIEGQFPLCPLLL